MRGCEITVLVRRRAAGCGGGPMPRLQGRTVTLFLMVVAVYLLFSGGDTESRQRVVAAPQALAAPPRGLRRGQVLHGGAVLPGPSRTHILLVECELWAVR